MNKKESKSDANVATMDGNNSDSFIFLLSITPTVCYLEKSEWILNTGAT